MSLLKFAVSTGVEEDCYARPALQLLSYKQNKLFPILMLGLHQNMKAKDYAQKPDAAAYTNGYYIKYHEKFSKMPLPEQVFIVLHEVLHIALAHPFRGLALKNKYGEEYSHEWFNIAADCLINGGLNELSFKSTGRGLLSLPDWVCTVERIMHKIGQTDINKDALPEKLQRSLDKINKIDQWNVEGLYLFFMELMKIDPEGMSSISQQYVFEQGDGLIELPAEEGQSEVEQEQMISEAIRITGSIMEGLKAGSSPGDLIYALSGDIPKIKTPWQKLLNSASRRALSDKSRRNWSRPSRRWIASATYGHVTEFEPRTQSNSMAPRIAVITDTSGSMAFSRDILMECAQHISKIAKVHKAEIHLIQADVGVTSSVKLNPAQLDREISKIEFKGGGGTEFGPAILEAEKISPSVIIYLTDTWATFPAKPKAPIIWAIPESVYEKNPNRDNFKVPYGRQIFLE